MAARLLRRIANDNMGGTMAVIEKSTCPGRRASFLGLAGLVSAITFGLASCSDHAGSVKDLLDDLASAVDDLDGKINDLGSSVDSFSDGTTSWRDIVPEVVSGMEDVRSAFQDLSDTFSSLQEKLSQRVEWPPRSPDPRTTARS